MYNFLKNSSGEYVEGYLGSKENFNGIVLLLREPNNKDKTVQDTKQTTEEFWFKKVLWDFDSYHKELTLKNEPDDKIAKSKRAATKYINRFNEMLKAAKFDESSKFNAAFCNIHPEYGKPYKTDVYNDLLKERSKAILDYLSSAHSNITIFTCRDIYAQLKEYVQSSQEVDGFVYKRNTLKKFSAKYNSCNITVYEIYHPSFSGKILIDAENRYV
ncbi:MAG: hypothetical protein IJA80_07715 [Clostridia bacterium]|nr:hypothetical protein [Clostridia bacterium]